MIPTQETIQKASRIIAEIERLQAEMLSLFGGTATPATSKAAGRRATKPAAAATASASAASTPGKKKRNMTAAGRARIAAAARARWARFHAARKATAAR